jgi:hypothetical protein
VAKKKAPTAEERRYRDKVAALGCLICGMPANLHHVRQGVGMGQKAAEIGGLLPLCHIHHQNGGYGVAFHAGKKEWQKNYGTEAELLEEVARRLGDY